MDGVPLWKIFKIGSHMHAPVPDQVNETIHNLNEERSVTL